MAISNETMQQRIWEVTFSKPTTTEAIYLAALALDRIYTKNNNMSGLPISDAHTLIQRCENEIDSLAQWEQRRLVSTAKYATFKDALDEMIASKEVVFDLESDTIAIHPAHFDMSAEEFEEATADLDW